MPNFNFAFAIVIGLSLISCDSGPKTPAEHQQYREQQEAACSPILITAAPDGTKLWKVNSRYCDAVYTTVYFSSSGGTNWRSGGGKSSRLYTVPFSMN